MDMESAFMAAKSIDLCSILYADQVTDGGVEELLELCERHRLQMDISMRSEWNPGETLGVLLWRQALNPFIPPHLLPERV